MRRRTLVRRTLAVTLTVVAAGLGLVAYLLLDSLPRTRGEARIVSLSSRVRVELDRYAIPRIIGADMLDVFRAQGFIHAQQRFFQMDLMRRNAAGELAELFGRRALAADRERRVFQFRARARALLAALPTHERAYLEAYATGVGAGLADLGTRPPEYLLLGQRPAAWRAEDSLLVVYSIYTMLSNSEDFERGQDVMRAVLPPALYELLTPSSSRFDQPIAALASADPTGGYRPAAIPPATVVDLRGIEHAPADIVRQPLAGAASNQWALPATRTASGQAILANDPHLGLRVPSTFFRAELDWNGTVVRGVSIPGIPGILLGATDRIAWGATVSYADQADLVVIEVDPRDADRYATPEGFVAFVRETEQITVAGAQEPIPLEVTTTRWGPIIGTNWRGQPLALRATWLDPDGLDLSLLDLPRATSADAAVERLARWSGPSLNWLVADADGAVAWTVNGPLPARRNFDGAAPESWADGTRAWHGRLLPPRIPATRTQALFTANNRSLTLEDSLQISRTWRPPFRARRIAELLARNGTLAERDSLAMQLDTEAAAYVFVRDAVLAAVAGTDPNADVREARALIEAWNGRADVEQPGFTLLHRYYDALLEAVLGPLLAPVRAADPSFIYRWPLADEPLRRILETRPAHLLPNNYADWSTLLRDVLVETLASRDPRVPAGARNWGEINRLDIAHPLAAIPGIGTLMRYTAAPLPGSPVSLRVATPQYGAVFRMNVAPAAPADGILELAGGQSGHFLSRHFSDLLADWVAGAPTPFLAGPTVDQFTLTP